MAISPLKRTTLLLITFSAVAITWNSRHLHQQLSTWEESFYGLDLGDPPSTSRILTPRALLPDRSRTQSVHHAQKPRKAFVRLRSQRSRRQQDTSETDGGLESIRYENRKSSNRRDPSVDSLPSSSKKRRRRAHVEESNSGRIKQGILSREINQKNDFSGSISSREEAGSSSWLVPSQPDVAVATRLRNTVVGYAEPLQSCHPTAQVRIIAPPANVANASWILQSIDEFGQDKNVGGDEYYITYQQKADQKHYDLAAIQTDNHDGTYTLDFVTVPMNPHPPPLAAGGVLKVYFQFTCDLGRVPPPLKVSWIGGGATLVVHERTYLPRVPPYREFVPPNSDGRIDLGKYHMVLSFGDSLMRQLVRRKGTTPFMNNTYFHGNIYTTVEMHTLDDVLSKLEEFYGDALRSSNRTHKYALIMGSSVWDLAKSSNVQGSRFDDHIKACRILVQTAMEQYPMADLYWKSASAVHIHRLSPHCYESHDCRVSYQTSSRIKYLYDRQKALMEELGVTHLDVQEALYLSADYCLPGDIRHFEEDMCGLLQSYFYRAIDYLAFLK